MVRIRVESNQKCRPRKPKPNNVSPPSRPRNMPNCQAHFNSSSFSLPAPHFASPSPEMLGIHIGCCREMLFWLFIAGIGVVGLFDVYDLAHRKFTFSVFPPQTSPDFASVFPLNEAFLSDGGVGDEFGILGVPWCEFSIVLAFSSFL